MYKKMIKVSSNEPTADSAEETSYSYNRPCITKARYLQWRETSSSTLDVGCRIEETKVNIKIPPRQ